MRSAQTKVTALIAIRRAGAAWLFAVPMMVVVALGVDPPTVTPRPVANARTLVDLTRRIVTIPQDPRRIVVLGPELDLLATIDPCSNRIAGSMRYMVEKIASAPAGIVCSELASTPVASTSFTPDPERILALSPDLVVGTAYLASNLAEIGFPSIVQIDYLGNVSQSRDRIWNLMGSVLRAQPRAAQLQANFYKTLAALNRRPQNKEPPVRVLLMDGTPGSWRVSDGYYLTDLWKMLDSDYVASRMHHGARINQEDLLRLHPNVILLGQANPATLFDDPAWQVVTAVRKRRVYRMPNVNVYNQPLDLTLLVAWMMAVLQPGATHVPIIAIAQQLYMQIFDRAPSKAQLQQLFECEANRRSRLYPPLLRSSQ